MNGDRQMTKMSGERGGEERYGGGEQGIVAHNGPRRHAAAGGSQRDSRAQQRKDGRDSAAYP